MVKRKTTLFKWQQIRTSKISVIVHYLEITIDGCLFSGNGAFTVYLHVCLLYQK